MSLSRIAAIILSIILILSGIALIMQMDEEEAPERAGGVASDELPGQYDYAVSGNVVRDSNGGAAHTSDDFTHALMWAVEQPGKTIYIPSGQYRIDHRLRIADAATIYGDGDGANGTVLNFSDSEEKASLQMYGTSEVRLMQFRVANGNIEISSSAESYDGPVSGGHLLQDITVVGTPPSTQAAFFVWVRENGGSGVVENLRFVRCKALDVGGMGFHLGGGGANTLSEIRNTDIWVRNVSFDDCRAERCGIGSRYNNYICGYDLAEGVNVENVSLYRGNASGNWMNGFHFEGFPFVKRVTFTECDARDNGVGKVSNGANAGWNIWRSEPYNNDVTLVNCTGQGNEEGDVFQGYSFPILDLPPSG